jgi:predicted lipid-binding transport protein (Tim44 family)
MESTVEIAGTATARRPKFTKYALLIATGLALSLGPVAAYAQAKPAAGCTQKAGEGESAGKAQNAGEGESAGKAQNAGEGESAGKAQNAGEGESAGKAQNAGEGESAGKAQNAASTATPCPKG